MRLRDVFYPAMFDELLQHLEEYAFRVLERGRGAVNGETSNDFVLGHVEEEVKLICLREELNRSDNHLEIVFLIEQVVDHLRYFLDLPQLLADVLNAQHLTVLAELLLLTFNAKIKSVGLLEESN